jgi:thiamine-phosphate pyrophosphorylase
MWVSRSGKYFISNRLCAPFRKVLNPGLASKEMPSKLQAPHRPLLYLITSGQTNTQTTQASEEFSNVLRLVEAAVAAQIDLIQIREKDLSTRVLHQLSTGAAAITRGSLTKLLVNDRADVAVAARADGVHLTTQSLPTDLVRRTFGDEFLIGVSTHSRAEADAASRSGADFVVFGPVFDTLSKRQYGEPLGVQVLKEITTALSPFPVVALGGVTTSNAAECIEAGAAGVAGIRLLNERLHLAEVVKSIRR